ncbi:MAG: COG1361 S-layer family protein [Candidatus Micrarchaeota archaeon]
MKKNILLAAMAVAILLSIAPYSNAATQGLGSTLLLSGLQFLPNPAVPGQYVEAWIGVQNNKADAEAVQCELRPEYPFTLDSNENATRNIGNVGTGQSIVLKYKVRVDASAVLGDNALKIACRTGSTGWVEAKMNISVQTQAQSLAVKEISLDTGEIAPGSKATMTVSLENLATTPVRDVSVRLDVTSETLPFAPIQSGTEKTVPFIAGRGKLDVEFKLVAFASAEPKAYKIPLKISFKDYLGNSYSLNDTAGVIVNAKPILETFVEESKILRDNTGGKILVKIVNKGLSEAKFLNVRAHDSLSVKIVSPQVYYVGNLDSDDFETIEYTLFVTNAGKRASVPLTLEYRDANNNEYTDEAIADFQLYSDDEIAKLGLEQAVGTNWLLFIAIAVAAFAGYKFWWKKRAKH